MNFWIWGCSFGSAGWILGWTVGFWGFSSGFRNQLLEFWDTLPDSGINEISHNFSTSAADLKSLPQEFLGIQISQQKPFSLFFPTENSFYFYFFSLFPANASQAQSHCPWSEWWKPEFRGLGPAGSFPFGMTGLSSWTQSPSRGKRFEIAPGTIPGRNREFSPFSQWFFWLLPFPCGFQRFFPTRFRISPFFWGISKSKSWILLFSLKKDSEKLGATTPSTSSTTLGLGKCSPNPKNSMSFLLNPVFFPRNSLLLPQNSMLSPTNDYCWNSRDFGILFPVFISVNYRSLRVRWGMGTGRNSWEFWPRTAPIPRLTLETPTRIPQDSLVIF